MTGFLADSIHAILLDIEGTTTSISFVYEVLFPYAREHVKEYLKVHEEVPAVRSVLADLRELHAAESSQGLNPPPLGQEPSASLDSLVAYLIWLMDRDSKATPLKNLQGMIWTEGYDRGELKGHIYPDVPVAFQRWSKAGKRIAIFSSGSVQAQKLLFGSTTAGALTAYISTFFDTSTGPKRESQSYRTIANTLNLPPQQVLFISDVTEELDAAANAGMKTLLCIRPGNRPQPASQHESIRSFDDVG